MSTAPGLARYGRDALAKHYMETGTLGPGSPEVPVTKADIEQASHYADLADRLEGTRRAF